MKFTSLEIYEVKIPFRLRFKHALADRHFGHSLLLCLAAESGDCGWGEIVPRDYLTGETVETALDDLCNLWWPLLRGVELQPDKAGVIGILKSLFVQAQEQGRGASYSGIDLAVHDVAARVCRLPLLDFFAAKAKSVLLTAPLGGSSAGSVFKKAWLFKLLGFKEYKIKLGLGCDHEVLHAARKVIGADADLRADVNAGWGVEEGVALAGELAKYKLSSIEQPVADIDGLARFRRETGVKVMADESLCTLADARSLIVNKAADLWNVRLAKVGGFLGLQELVRLAGENGIGLHLGSLVGETSLLQAAGRVAYCLGDFQHVEYAFPRIFLKPDPFRGGPAGYFGKGGVQRQRPGLGVFPDKKSLAKVCLNKITLA